MAFLRKYILNPQEFTFSPELLNRMQSETLDDFEGTAYGPTIDYQLHSVALAIQESALSRLYSPIQLNRLNENVNRFKPGEQPYTMHEMFAGVRGSIWGDGGLPANTSTFGRQLQMVIWRD